MSPKALVALAAVLRTTYTLSRDDREALAALCDETANADGRVKRAVDAERDRCKELADLAVEYAKDADWSRVTGVLNLLARADRSLRKAEEAK